MQDILVSPLNKSKLVSYTDSHFQFDSDDQYPVIEGIPILISATNSLFKIGEIISQKPQTQNKEYSNKKRFKNFIRAVLLPKLNKDWNLESRYSALAEIVSGKRVLIIGAGDKVEFYKRIFSGADVITSDVHMQFKPDVVFDVHNIPFKDSSFDLIVAGQVFEHTIRPWIAAQELERVSVHGGLIQIEVPFAFPYHGAPYDFFRFTFTGLRAIFRSCAVRDYKASEGVFAAVAVVNSQALLEISSNKAFRYVMLIVSRLLFFGLKYLDLFSSGRNLSDFSMPKGYYVTFKKDGKLRTDQECLDDFELLKVDGQRNKMNF